MGEIEDLLVCSEDVGYGGIAQQIWYALAEDIKTFNFPTATDYEGRKRITQENIRLKSGKKLKGISVFMEQNALSEKTAVGTRKSKLISELNFSVLGFRAKNLGFVSKLKNEALVFFVPDANGKIWIFGNPRNGAYLTNYESTTGKKNEDDAMMNLSYTANSELYLLDGSLEI